MYEIIIQSADYIREKTKDFSPQIGIILGSGLGDLVKEWNVIYKIPYTDIPNFPISTVAGHSGNLIFAESEKGKRIIMMQGRFHPYEGYSMQTSSFPIFVMKSLGVKKLIVSNAAGGLNPNFKAGDIMLISDHLNLTGQNPLIGPNDERLGTRFPSMSNAYNKNLIEQAESIAKKLDFHLQKGVYAGLLGPNYETPAECRYLRIIGSDAVGMSTVGEVIAANYAQMEVLGFSLISNMSAGDKLTVASHEEVLLAAKAVIPKLICLVKQFIDEL